MCFTIYDTYVYADELKVICKFIVCDVLRFMHEPDKFDYWCRPISLELNTENCGWLCLRDVSLNIKPTINENMLPKCTSKTDLVVHYLHILNIFEHIFSESYKMRQLPKFIFRNFFQNVSKISFYKTYVRHIGE